jgi:hypothetical protein
MQFQPDGQRGWPVFVIPLALLTACLAGLTMYRLRAGVHQVRDTRGFQDALRAWTPLVHSHRATPRAIKRFANRIRYLAMLHQAERLDESGFDTLRRRCDLIEAVLRRLKLVGCSWPPSHEELDAFEVSLRGIRAPAT